MTRQSGARRRETKTDTIRRLLSRKTGADLSALQKATGWQPHSVRAALSGMRKTACRPRVTERAEPTGSLLRRRAHEPAEGQ